MALGPGTCGEFPPHATLAGAIAAAAIPLVSAPLVAADPPVVPLPVSVRPNRIGISTYSFWRFLDNSRVKIEDCIRHSAGMGFDAVEILHRNAPGLMADGEMQADTAVTPEIIQSTYPFSTLKGGANVLVFPNLEAGNVAYKLLARLGKR